MEVEGNNDVVVIIIIICGTSCFSFCAHSWLTGKRGGCGLTHVLALLLFSSSLLSILSLYPSIGPIVQSAFAVPWGDIEGGGGGSASHWWQTHCHMCDILLQTSFFALYAKINLHIEKKYQLTTYKSIWNEYLCQVLAMPKAIPGSMQTHWHRWVRSASCCTCGFSHRYTCDDLQVTHTRAQPYSRLVDAPVTIIQEYSWCILSSLHLSATSSCATQIIFKVYFHVFPWI